MLCLLAKKVNLPKPERTKQFPMPIVAIIYVIVAMIFMDKICQSAHLNWWASRQNYVIDTIAGSCGKVKFCIFRCGKFAFFHTFLTQPGALGVLYCKCSYNACICFT